MTLLKPQTGTFPVLRLELKSPNEVSLQFQLACQAASCYKQVALVSVLALVNETVPAGYH